MSNSCCTGIVGSNITEVIVIFDCYFLMIAGSNLQSYNRIVLTGCEFCLLTAVVVLLQLVTLDATLSFSDGPLDSLMS